MTQEERAAFLDNLPVAELQDTPYDPVPLTPRTFPASHAMMIYPARRPKLELMLEQMAAPVWRMFGAYGHKSHV